MAQMFPNQNLPESQKTLEWVKLHLQYAQGILSRRNNTFSQLNRLYNSYNGIKNTDAIAYIEKTYGRSNKSKFISYRLGRNKLELLKGEWLNTPLKPTVVTINSEAKVKKLDQVDLMKGALMARSEVEKLKGVGVDVLEGMELPQGDPDEVWNSMSFKDKNEHVMQLIIDNAIPELDLKHKLSKNFLDIEIGSMCYGRIEMDDEGCVDYRKIDPRDAIFDEIDGDDFLERSPIMGARYRMTLSEVCRKYKLTKEQKLQIKAYEGQGNYENGIRKPGAYTVNGDFCVDVIHIEWVSTISLHYKKSPKTNKQKEFDNSTDYYKVQVDTEDYEGNKAYYDKQVEKGKLLGIDTEYAEDIREAVLIAGIIPIDLGRKKFQSRKVDSPNKVVGMSYVGCLYNTVDGVRISLQDIVYNFDAVFDTTMYQLLRELNTNFGRVGVFDRAGLPQDRTMRQIVYDIKNDGFVDIDSSADGNESGRELSLDHILKVVDMGLSGGFQQLLVMKNDIVQTLDQLTGINENRQGSIAASSTVTNTQFAVSASKNITTPMFFAMNKFVEKLMIKLCEAYKISYAFYKIEKGRQILGDAQQKFLEVEKEIGYCDYGVYMEDGSTFAQHKAEMMALIEPSLNAKLMRPEDIMDVQKAQSYAEAKAVLRRSWRSINEIAMQQQQQAEQAAAEQQAQALQAQQQMMLENREDIQAAKLEAINVQADADIRVNKNQSMNKMIVDTNNIDQKAATEQQPPMI